MKSQQLKPESQLESIAPVTEAEEDRILLHEVNDEVKGDTADKSAEPPAQRRLLRWTLLTLAPVLLLGSGAYVYLTGGRGGCSRWDLRRGLAGNKLPAGSRSV